MTQNKNTQNATVAFSPMALAFPETQITQEEVVLFAQKLLQDSPQYFERMRPAFEHAGINTRHSCVPLDWYLQDHSWSERAEIFNKNAIPMLIQAGKDAIAKADIDPKEIQSVITICSTGITTPSLEAHVAPHLGLNPYITRVPIFGLGCAGGVAAMARATDLCRAGKGPVLVLVTELCGLTFRAHDKSKSNVIATALFGDGAAAMVVGHDKNIQGHFIDFQEFLWPDSIDVMGWRVEDDSLGVIFSRDIPNLVKNDLTPIATDFLHKHNTNIDDIAGVILHPGGTKVLDAYQECFGHKAGIDVSRAILAQYGNMSSVTVMAVLERMMGQHKGLHLTGALGPGFSAGLGMLELV